MLSSIQFTPLHDTCPSPPPTPPSPPATSFCQSLAAFIEPLGAPLGGFLAEGFTTREEEEEILRSRATYRLKGGKMIKLDGGVSDFEAVMEKRVEKLMAE